MTAVGGGAGGSFQLGFEMHPLTQDGNLDTSLDNKGIMHSVETDMLYKLALQNRENGNAAVKDAQYEQAIGRYSEVIMQLRSLENEQDVRWDDSARLKVRELRAAAYLNLSLCFLKLEQWTHCINTATRALQGDRDPPDARDAVLAPDKRAKALFRRASAQCEGFGNFDKARDDLRKALEHTPDDKAIEQMLRKCEVAVRKTEKAANKKMNGFLVKEVESGEGLFDDSLRPSAESLAAKPKLKDTVKLSEGLWLRPQDDGARDEMADRGIDLEELGSELKELKDENPEQFERMRENVRIVLEQQAKEAEREGDEDAAAEAAVAGAEAAGS